MNARTVLWILTFIGFAINYMIRINMNITIVDMILPAAKTVLINNKTTTRMEPECYVRVPANQSLFLHSSEMDNTSEAVAVAWRNETQCQRFSFERVLLDWMEVSLLKIYGVPALLILVLQIDYDHQGFDWNEHRQGLLLGSFFWLHWVTQIPGGVLARKYGTKLIFGTTNLVGCLICVLMPICAYLDYNTLIMLRVVQGCICVGLYGLQVLLGIVA